jgi:hypothetical protein
VFKVLRHGLREKGGIRNAGGEILPYVSKAYKNVE